jgi:protein arginine kinase activator
MQPNLSWINLLAGLAEHDFGISHPVEFKKRCTRCGFTYDDFKKTQRLGCPDCYNTFQVQINKILRKIHGSIKHAGKTPGKTSKATKIRKEIEKLRKELQDAISLEEYERAAVLRDKIKEAEKILSKEE